MRNAKAVRWRIPHSACRIPTEGSLVLVIRYPLFLALRYLRSRRISYLAMASIALSLGTILTVLYVLWGLSREIERQIRGVQPDLTVRASSSYGLTDYAPLVARLSQLDGVKAVSPVLSQWVLLERGRRYVPAQIFGIDPQAESRVVDLAAWCGGAVPPLASDGTQPAAWVGEELADVAGLWPGEKVGVVGAVHSSPSSAAPTYLTLGRATFSVGRIFRSWDYQTDRYSFLTALSEAQKLLRRYSPAAISEIRMRLSDPQAAPAMKEAVEEVLREADPAARVATWQEMNPQGLAWVDAENRVMAVILSLILVAVCFGIAVILSTLVREKTRDIGVLKSMGATTGGVARLFVLCGTLIGLAGATLGVALSFLAESNIDWIDKSLQQGFGYDFAIAYHLERMPTHIDPQAVFLLWLLAVGVSVLASLWPAVRAARLEPVETLRYE